MEILSWQQCQRKSFQCSTTLNILPPLWDTVSVIYNQVLKLVSKFPGRKRLVLYFAYKGATVKVDLGDVKAAGAVCVLGVGIGLGTVLVYRLYNHYIRPLLDILQQYDPEYSPSTDCTAQLDSSDSAVDGTKGGNLDQLLSAHVSYLQYAVAFCGKASRSHQQRLVDSVRLRRSGTPQKPVRIFREEKDTRHGGGLYLSPGLHDVNFRDSFYSTAESGFETLPELNEEEEEEDIHNEYEQRSRKLFSVTSDRNKPEPHFSSSSGERTHSSPGNKTLGDVSLDNDGSSGLVTVLHNERLIHTAKSSPAHKTDKTPVRLLSSKKHHSYPRSLDDEFDLDGSIQSFNSSGEEWSWEVGEECPLPPDHAALTDEQFQQSLMQRIHDWSAGVEEYQQSRSPSPDLQLVRQSQEMRRSRSLDRYPSGPLFIPHMDVSSPVQVEDCTIKNLESLETEFHDIQDEFESITSKLHDLIERGVSEEPRHTSSESATNPHNTIQASGRSRTKHRHQPYPSTKWESFPRSGSCSSHSSRSSSVEFSWDCGGVGGCVRGRKTVRLDGDEGLQSAVMDPGGDGVQCVSSSRKRSLNCSDGSGGHGELSVGEAVCIQDHVKREWKGGTHKASVIRQGYAVIPDLFRCRRLRKIKGDKYSALRSALFQVLVAGQRSTLHWPGPVTLIDKLHSMHEDASSGLSRWKCFGQTKSLESDQFDGLTVCVLTLYAVIEEVSLLTSTEEREKQTTALLNDIKLDGELMEGLKIMMLYHASQLHSDMVQGQENVPTFTHRLFARCSSCDLVGLVENHLNLIGHSACLDEVEMGLLAQTLGVQIRVARLHHYPQDDFDCCFPDHVPESWSSGDVDCCFPDHVPESWPCVWLLTEDDHSYHVPLV